MRHVVISDDGAVLLLVVCPDVCKASVRVPDVLTTGRKPERIHNPPDLIQTTRQNAIAYSAHRSAGSAIAKISKRGGGVAIGGDGRNRFACIPVGDVAAHVFRIEREVLASA